MDEAFEGTAEWVRGQWSNPADIFTILLIIGGDIIQIAIAQLCAGPLPYFTPVSFSFGWVTYAVSAMRSAVGENRLMPRPDLDCIVINAESGYARRNYSWVLSRLLRDYEFWRPRICDRARDEKLRQLRQENDRRRQELEVEKIKATTLEERRRVERTLARLPKTQNIKVGLRISVWNCGPSTGRGQGDWIYWIGILVTLVQFGVSAIPWGLYGEWFTFLATAAGTTLAYMSGMLPQWAEEKLRVRSLEKPKRVFLTAGNGSNEVILILAHPGDTDLEDLASPHRELRSPRRTRVASLVLAVCWVAFLVTVAGWQQHSWYLVGVGMIGILHNVTVAGTPRRPGAWGLNLQYKRLIAEGKVMQSLRQIELLHPMAGKSLLAEYFPGDLFPREVLFWAYARRRYLAWRNDQCPVDTSGAAIAWNLPPLLRPHGALSDDDIPAEGEYHPQTRITNEAKQNADPAQAATDIPLDNEPSVKNIV